jgi:hypothetical protein
MSPASKAPVLARVAVVVLTASAAASGGAHAASLPPGPSQSAPSDGATIPPQLEVPAGQQLVATLQVDRGSQVYTCSASTWTLREPAAVLRSGSEEVLHTQGPQWISVNDGSAVTGTTSATVPVSGAIPELLVKATANRGDGLFATVDFIQRLDTRGGLPPAGTCTDGTQTAVGYSAIYRFYSPAPPPKG